MTLPARSLPDSYSLAELVDATRSGDSAAIGALYDRFAPRLYRIAFRLTRSAADAEDVLHDVFVALPESLRRYEERGSLEQWLVRVTGRTALMRLRAQGRRRETVLHETQLGTVPVLPDAEIEQREAARQVERGLQALPETLRSVFELRFREELSHEEIASILGITPGASRVRLNRAIEALRRLLISYGIGR